MSLNNSVLTRASKSGEFVADAIFYQYNGKTYNGGTIQAIKFYGIQRGRPILSKLADWFYDIWLAREPGPIEMGNETLSFVSLDKGYSIRKGNYIVQLPDGNIIETSADIFERDYQPIISAK